MPVLVPILRNLNNKKYQPLVKVFSTGMANYKGIICWRGVYPELLNI